MKSSEGIRRTFEEAPPKLLRFYTTQHQLYCGIDLHVRTIYVCILNRDGEVLLHRHMKAAPEPFLKAIVPYREDIVVCVEWTVHVVLAR